MRSGGHLLFLCACCLCPLLGQQIGETETVYEWAVLEYDWPTDAARDEAIRKGDFIPENNIITGIKIFRGEIYVTVSRWLPGIPSTMNKVITKDGKPVLQPYPSWEWEDKDNCERFQFTQSMEIDPATGYMWIIDTGRLNVWTPEEAVNRCPAKLVVWDMINNREVRRFEFPDHVLDRTRNFVNDIALDPEGGWAYMSDVGYGSSGHRGGMVVLDINANKAHRIEHSSMAWEPDGYIITINGKTYDYKVPIDGIALNPEKNMVFYCPLGGYNLYQLPTRIAQRPELGVDANVRKLGRKSSQTDGMIFGMKGFYYGAMGLNSVWVWKYRQDMEEQGLSMGQVEMRNSSELSKDDVTMIWADTFALTDEGWLYTTANRLPQFRSKELDFTGKSGANFRINRIYVDDVSYLASQAPCSVMISPLLLWLYFMCKFM